jgi:hypothetical protein
LGVREGGRAGAGREEGARDRFGAGRRSRRRRSWKA